MSRVPVQARSLESMHRMLDAGEELFGLGGIASVKLELILERSGASTGSFYGRFGGMRGFLEALHQRSLERLSAAVLQAQRQAASARNLEQALTVFCSVMVATIRENPATFRYFAVEQAHESTYRVGGISAQLQARSALVELVGAYLVSPVTATTMRRVDMVYRMVLAMLFQQFMFTSAEISPLDLDDEVLVREWVAVLVAALEPLRASAS